jgi:hypothetical protein
VVGNGAALSVSEPWKAFIAHAKHSRCAILLNANQPPNLLMRPPQPPQEYFQEADRNERQALASELRERDRGQTVPPKPQDPRLARNRKQMMKADREEGEILSDDSDQVLLLPDGSDQGMLGLVGGAREKRKGAPPETRAEESRSMERKGTRGRDHASQGCANKRMRHASGAGDVRGTVTLLSSSDEEVDNRGRPPFDTRDAGVVGKQHRGTGARGRVAGSDAGEQLVCADCQMHFWFSSEERLRLLGMGVTASPSRCRPWCVGGLCEHMVAEAVAAV